MTDTASRKVLRRYTSLPSLLDMAQRKQLTLLSPTLWDDRNDAYFMRQYRQRKGLKSLLAACFAENDETYHHWRVFTRAGDGVCVTFRRDELLAAFAGIEGIRYQRVKYKKIRDIGDFSPRLAELPFLKRQPYRDEKEFRIIYESAVEETEAKGFDVPLLRCVERITLGPWLARPLANAAKIAIKSQPGCSGLKVYQTTLLENENWKKAAQRSRA